MKQSENGKQKLEWSASVMTVCLNRQFGNELPSFRLLYRVDFFLSFEITDFQCCAVAAWR